MNAPQVSQAPTIETLGRDKMLSLDCNEPGLKEPEVVHMVTRSRSTTPANEIIISQQHFGKDDLQKMLLEQEVKR